MTSVFISYRRADTPAWAGRIADRLTQSLGADQVFIDIDSLNLGEDFTERIESVIPEMDFVLVIIGPAWISERADGQPRIFDRDDPIRFEVATALRAGVAIVPILVDGAHMPTASSLPPDLQPIPRMHGVRLSPEGFSPQVEQLVADLGGAAEPTQPQRGNPRRIVALAATAIIAVLGAVLLLRSGETATKDPSAGASPTVSEAETGTSSSISSVTDQPLETQTVKAVAAGSSHTCALTDAGKAWCWGANGDGQLGDGSTSDRASPVPVRTDLSFEAIVTGARHTCALVDSSAWCWGGNSSGQLGDSTFESRISPVELGGDFDSLTAGGTFTCGLSAGQASCWGSNQYGALGVPGENRAAPTLVGIEPALSELSAGGNHVCGRTVDGFVWCWGNNSVGQLGVASGFGTGSIGSPEGGELPTIVPDLVGTRQVVAADWSTCALRTNGQVACWGSNSDGQLGDGGTSDRFEYQNIDDLWDVRSLAADGHRACALTSGSRLQCWGHNSFGEIGGSKLGHPVTQPTEREGIPPIVDGSDIAAGNWHACVVSEGELSCWGSNDRGQLGQGSIDRDAHPEPVLVTIPEETSA